MATLSPPMALLYFKQIRESSRHSQQDSECLEKLYCRITGLVEGFTYLPQEGHLPDNVKCVSFQFFCNTLESHVLKGQVLLGFPCSSSSMKVVPRIPTFAEIKAVCLALKVLNLTEPSTSNKGPDCSILFQVPGEAAGPQRKSKKRLNELHLNSKEVEIQKSKAIHICLMHLSPSLHRSMSSLMCSVCPVLTSLAVNPKFILGLAHRGKCRCVGFL